jgi:hypothetical protein
MSEGDVFGHLFFIESPETGPFEMGLKRECGKMYCSKEFFPAV